MAGRSREATSTIKGYYYQFDYFILQLLQLQDDDDSVRIEGIEDVDIVSDDGIEAVQCKYYDGTACSPSVIGKAVRPMLQHFAENKDSKLTYKLYGHYNSGEDSISMPLTVEYMKKKFFTYTESKKKHVLHDELELSDEDLKKFLERFDLQLYADTYDSQIEKIIAHLQTALNCTEFDARYFYYSNAVAFVKDVAVKKSASARTITKARFRSAIGTRQGLFDQWYIEYIGFEKYYKAARRQFFTQNNISPKNRFFLIECDGTIGDADIADLVLRVSEKWSRLSQREQNPFCPYVYLRGINASRLATIKRILFENDIHIWDGYEYKDADFSASSIARTVNHHIGVKAKMINKSNQILDVLNACSGAKEVYQFYLQKPFYSQDRYMHKEFQIQTTNDVLKIV